MTQRSRFWDGTATGDASGVSPYDAPTEFAEVLSSLAGCDVLSNRGGVFLNDSGQSLQGTVPGANTLRVSVGRALVYGSWFYSDATEDFNIPTPAASTRVDRIVLRKSWSAQTVRLTRIAGTEGAGAPAMTQSVGTTYDIPICQVSITTGGAMTVTDERVILNGPVKLAEIILTADAASVTISGIQQGFRSLVLGFVGRTTRAATSDELRVRFNGDASANYYSEVLQGQAATPSAIEDLGTTSALAGLISGDTATANGSGQVTMTIHDYSTTGFNKTWTAQSIANLSAVTTGVVNRASAGFLNVTTAITSLVIFASFGSLKTSSKIVLWGWP